MKRKAYRLKACAALALIAALAGQLGVLTPAGGEPVHSVTQFSDGSEEASFYFTQQSGVAITRIALPRTAYVTSAQLCVRGLPGQDGSYPADAGLGVGASGSSLWSFGERQAGAGEMGRQQTFSDGREAEDIRFPPGGGVSSSLGILIPGDAVIRSASLQLVGGEGPHGAPRLYGNVPQETMVAWNALRGRPVVARVSNATITVSEMDPATGAEMRHRELPIGPGQFSYLADFQYCSEEDTAAMLLPGVGICLLDLGTGDIQKFCDGPQNRSLTAMRYGGGWLAAIGIGWVELIELPAGKSIEFNSSSLPGALAGKPVGVDYDPAGARLFTACDMGDGEAHFSVIGTANGSFSHFTASELPGSLSAMRYLPGKEQLMFGLGGTDAGEMAGPVMVLDLLSGAFRSHPLFTGGQRAESLQIEADRAASMVSSSEFVVVNLQDETYEILPVAFPGGSPAGSWSFDFGGKRLLAAISSGELYILDFKSGRGFVLSPPDSVPAGVSSVRASGSTLLMGTQAGAVAMSKGGTLRWRLDCGAVSSLSVVEAPGILAVGASEGWSLDSTIGTWGFSRLNLTLLDISASPPSARSWQVPLGKGEGRSTVSAMALDMAGGRLFFGVSSGDEGRGLRELNLSTGSLKTIASRTLQPESLVLSRDMKTLYAGSKGDGLLIMDLSTGAQRTLNTYNASGLLSPFVSSLMVDEFGRLLAGQADYGKYAGGLTVFSPDLASTRSYSAHSSHVGGGIDVRSLARDPKTMRIFLGLGNSDGLMVIDENANTQMMVGGLFGGLDGAGFTARDICWSPEDRTLLGAGSGLGFALQWAGEYPQNVGLDVGADGTVDWTGPGKLESAFIPDIAAVVQGALAASGGGSSLRLIPFRLSSTSAGIVGLGSLAVTYDWSRRIDIRESLRSALASRPAAGNGTVSVFLEAYGGGLSLFDLSITYLDDHPPVAKSIPALTADTAARAPTILDMGRYFTDGLSPAGELTYAVRQSRAPAGVEISLLFSRYLLIDSRGSSFRGHITVNVTATDSTGLSTSKEFQVKVARSNEYAPPAPAYNIFLWVSAGVLAVVGCWILILYYRLKRAKKD